MALISAGLLSLASCEKKGSEEPTTKTTLTASMEQQGGNTKTFFNNSTKDVFWSANDKISVFYGDETENKEFTLESGDGSATGTFTGTAGTGTTIFAFYPNGEDVTIDGSHKISFTLPSEQTYRPEGGFAEKMNPMVAYGLTVDNLSFKNLCGILKIQLTGSVTIKRIIVRSQTTKLSGDATVEMNYGEEGPVISMASDAENTVSLNLGAGVALTGTAHSFYIVVPPMSVSDANKLTVHVESATGSMLKSTQNASASVERSFITPMSELSYADATDGIYRDNGLEFGMGVTVALGGSIGDRTFAPVNCGYDATNYKYGKLYQWGRRDGQGYQDGTYDDAADAIVEKYTVETWDDNGIFSGIPEAGAFYEGHSNTYDWYTNTSGKGLTKWDHTNVEAFKDPCPAGWRVPTETELTALKANKSNWTSYNIQNGYWFSGSVGYNAANQNTSAVFFPAASSRNYNGDCANDRGTFGRYWSNTPNGDFAWYLFFKSDGTATVANYGLRAAGYSVRCVKK